MVSDNKKINPEKAKIKEKKKKERQDIITVLATLAIIILLGVVCSLFQRNPELIHFSSSGSGSLQEKEKNLEAVRTIVICLTVICIIIVALFIRSVIKTKKKKAEKLRDEERKRLELEEAKERVRAARLNAFLDAGKAEILERKKSDKYSDIYDDDYNYGYDEHQKMNYMAGRTSRHYTLGDFDDEIVNENSIETEEKMSLFQRIKRFFGKIFRKKNDDGME